MNLNYLVEKKNIFSLIISLIPVSFLLGNTVLNINIICIFLIYLIFFKKINFDFKIYTIDKIIFFFFFYIIIVLILNLVENILFLNWKVETQLIENYFSFFNEFFLKNYNIYILFKSVFFLRFLLLYIIIRSLIDKDLINLKWFIITSSVVCFFVTFDIFFQFIFNKNMFGIVPIHPRKLSGIFGPELIAGGFIQRFSLFLFFGFYYFFPTNKIKKISIFFIIIFVFLGIIFSGNRFPLILFCMSLILISFFKKKLTNFFIIFLLTLTLASSILFKNENIKINLINFKTEISEIFQAFTSSKPKKIVNSFYYYEFISFYETWKLNKYFGGGLRSFRIICKNLDKKTKLEYNFCNTHPHNYYLEILTDLGIFGFIIFFYLYLYIFFLFYKKFRMYNKTLNKFFLPFGCTLFIELFPIRSSGSFFTNSNATFIFIMISIVVSLIYKKVVIK